MQVDIKELTNNELTLHFFRHFRRFQQVTNCWRKENGTWQLTFDPFVEDWGDAEKQVLLTYLANTLQTGGIVLAAMVGEKLAGFSSLEGQLFGPNNEYLQLSSLHTSYEYRGNGIGKQLFAAMASKAKHMGAAKLYIGAHPAEETMLFYKKQRCQPAQYIHPPIHDPDPDDFQLEYSL